MSRLHRKEKSQPMKYFSHRDKDFSYDERKAATISLKGSTASSSDKGVLVDGGRVTITISGTYVVSGSSENVQLIVKTGNKDKVQIVLNGVTMRGSEAAIVVENADKTFLTVADGTTNSISDSSHHTNSKYDATIYSKDDLTLNA